MADTEPSDDGSGLMFLEVLLSLVVCVPATEMTIKWNKITGVHSLSSASQLIPLLLSVGQVIQILLEIIHRAGSHNAEADIEAHGLDDLRSHNRAGSPAQGAHAKKSGEASSKQDSHDESHASGSDHDQETGEPRATVATAVSQPPQLNRHSTRGFIDEPQVLQQDDAMEADRESAAKDGHRSQSTASSHTAASRASTWSFSVRNVPKSAREHSSSRRQKTK